MTLLIATSAHPASRSRATFWIVATLSLALAWRWIDWIHRFAVNVLYWDQWDFYRPFFNGEGLWGVFSYEHAPHRQGLGAVLVRLLAGPGSWNTRVDAYLVAFSLLTAALAAIPLARRCGVRGLPFAAIPLLFCNVHQYEVWVGPANPSHGAIPVLLLVAYANVWFCRSRNLRLVLSSVLTFLAIFTGFGIFIGVLQPIFLAVELRDAWRKDIAPVLAAFAALTAFWLLFFHGYHFDPAVPGFRFPWHPFWRYGEFIARMGGTFLGIADVGWSIAAGSALFAAMAAVALGAAWRLARRGIEVDPAAAARFALAGFTLIYAANTAVGRVSMGSVAATAPRYVTLLIPGALSILLGLASWRKAGWTAAAALLFTAAIIPATAFLRPNEQDDIRHYADGRQAWKNAYLDTGDADRADALSGFPVYPAPLLAARLQYLREHGLNLFHRPTPAQAKVQGDFARTTPDLDPNGDPALLRDRRLWDSRDRNGNSAGRLECGPFFTGSALEFWISGYPSRRGEAIFLAKTDGTERLPLNVRTDPGDEWCPFRWSMPPGWRGVSVKLVAEDGSTDAGDWIGISEPAPPSAAWFDAINLALRQILIAAALLLPGIAAAVLLPGRPTLGVLAGVLLVSAAAAHLLVYVCLASPEFGRFLAGAITAIALLIVLARREELARRCREIDFAGPLLLCVLAAALYSTMGFAYGGVLSPDRISARRFFTVLPDDPLLPQWLAERLANGLPLRPFAAGWLSSDRPPLQAALNLALWPWTDDSLGHTLIGIAAQSWIWVGLWIFMRSVGLRRRTQAFTLAAALTSGLFFVYSFYSWPKLLPAAFVLICAGFLFGSESGLSRAAATPLAAAAGAFAMLGHGGSAFAFIAFALVYASRRRFASWRALALSFIVFEVLYLPWQLYQRFVDPPGDRLLKYHLAGHTEIDPRPTLAVVREAYHRLSWSEIWHRKLENLGAVFWGHAGWLQATGASIREAMAGHPSTAWRHFSFNSRVGEFYHPIESLGPSLLACVTFLIAWARGKEEPRRAGGLVAGLAVVTNLVWCAMMFDGGSTVIHQGTLFLNGCLIVLAGIGLAQLPGVVAKLLLACNAVWLTAVWLLEPPRGYPSFHGWLPSSYPAFWVVAAALSIPLVVLIRRVARSRDPSAPFG